MCACCVVVYTLQCRHVCTSVEVLDHLTALPEKRLEVVDRLPALPEESLQTTSLIGVANHSFLEVGGKC